jgi:predicted transcriptional regulator
MNAAEAMAALARLATWLDAHDRPIHPVEAADMAALIRARGQPLSRPATSVAKDLGLHPQTVRAARKRYRETTDPDAPRIRVQRTRRGQVLSVENLWITCEDSNGSESPALTSPRASLRSPTGPLVSLVVVPVDSAAPLRGVVAGEVAPETAPKLPEGLGGPRLPPAPLDDLEDRAIGAELRDEARRLRIVPGGRPSAPLASWVAAVGSLRRSLRSRDRSYRVFRAALAHRPPEQARFRRSYGELLATDPERWVTTAWWVRAVESGWSGCPDPSESPAWRPYHPPALLSHADGAAWPDEGRAGDGAGLAEWEGYLSDLEHEAEAGELGAPAELAAALAEPVEWADSLLDGAAVAVVRWADPERDYGSSWRGIGRYRRFAARGHLGLVAWLARADAVAKKVLDKLKRIPV